MADKQYPQTGIDFPHDLRRQSRKPAQPRLTPPKPTKADRKRMKQTGVTL